MIKTERKQIKWSQTECCLPPASSLALIPSYMEDNVYTHTHAHTHAHARTHTHTRAHTHARTCTHTHTRTRTHHCAWRSICLFPGWLFVAMLIRNLMSEDSNALLGVTFPSSSLNPAPHSLHCLTKWTLCTHPCSLPHPTSLLLSPRWRGAPVSCLTGAAVPCVLPPRRRAELWPSSGRSMR